MCSFAELKENDVIIALTDLYGTNNRLSAVRGDIGYVDWVGIGNYQGEVCVQWVLPDRIRNMVYFGSRNEKDLIEIYVRKLPSTDFVILRVICYLLNILKNRESLLSFKIQHFLYKKGLKYYRNIKRKLYEFCKL